MHDSVKAIAVQATGLSASAIAISPRTPIGYQTNRLYDVWANGRHLIVKEFLLPAEQQDAPAREYKALKLLAQLDMAPQPVFYEPSLGPVVVYEYMEGEMWDRRHPTLAGLAQLADTWLKMNAVVSDPPWLSHGYDQFLERIAATWHVHFQAFADWVEADFAPGRQAAEVCLGLLESRRDVIRELAGDEPLLCFCQADPRFANVIQRPDGRLGLIDWEDCGLRDPARDLADIMTGPNQEDLLSPDEWQAFVKPYIAGRGALDTQLMRRTHLYQALFPIFWLTVIMNQGRRLAGASRLEGWLINGMPPNQRLRRYLARALAWPQLSFERELDALAGLEFFPDK